MFTKELLATFEKHGIIVNSSFDEESFEYVKKQIQKKYLKKDFEDINPSLIKFLYFFVGKELLFINGFGKPDNMHFRINRNCKLNPKYLTKSIERDFKLKGIIPFGSIYREHMSLLIDKENRVYANLDDLLIHYGNDPFEALYNILHNIELGRINPQNKLK